MKTAEPTCIFCNIQKQSKHLSYADDRCVAFDDINPQAPVHKLIIPRKHIATLSDTEVTDCLLLGHLFYVAQQIAASLSIPGYRVLLNCNPLGGQTVYHLHVHLLGGRQMTWPPG